MHPKSLPLLDLLSGLDSITVALSGGADSTLLAAMAHRALGDRARAVTAATEFTARRDLDRACARARQIGIPHRIVRLSLLDLPDLAANPADRCYRCKKAILTAFEAQDLADGTNADDDPARPGRRALAELGVRSPLAECGLTKADIRSLSRKLGLPGALDPSNSCLATRIPTGEPLTPADLALVEAAENLLHGLGLIDLRLRLTRPVPVLQLSPPDAARFPSVEPEATLGLARLGLARYHLGTRP